MTQGINVLIVDSDAAVRQIISRVIAVLPDIQSVDSAINGRVAIAKLKNKEIDLVLLELAPPETEGLETLKAIKASFPGAFVVMVSQSQGNNTDNVVKALEIGALDFVNKLILNDDNSQREFRLRLLTIIGLIQSRKNMQRVKSFSYPMSDMGKRNPTSEKKIELPAKALSPTPVEKAWPRKKTAFIMSRVDIVVIAASTGGPNALVKVIPALPGNLGVPVLIVQHMPPVMTDFLAKSLDEKSSLHVKEAVEGEVILANTVYIAPGGKHMTVFKENGEGSGNSIKYIRLNDAPPENSVRPSADVLFRSIPGAYGVNILSVIMTGMGNDGMRGVQKMKEEGCYCLSQSEETCVVYGMPKAVDMAGLSDENVPLEHLAERIGEVVMRAIVK